METHVIAIVEVFVPPVDEPRSRGSGRKVAPQAVGGVGAE